MPPRSPPLPTTVHGPRAGIVTRPTGSSPTSSPWSATDTQAGLRSIDRTRLLQWRDRPNGRRWLRSHQRGDARRHSRISPRRVRGGAISWPAATRRGWRRRPGRRVAHGPATSYWRGRESGRSGLARDGDRPRSTTTRGSRRASPTASPSPRRATPPRPTSPSGSTAAPAAASRLDAAFVTLARASDQTPTPSFAVGRRGRAPAARS
jgi:hypothetical protein